MVLIDNIKIADEGYYINLDSRVDRRNTIESQFQALGITGINRFSAFNEYDTGPINCKKSHLLIYEEFLKTDKEILLVLEDDCLFLDYLTENKSEIFKEIHDSDWDLFWLGCRNRRTPLQYKNKLYRVSSVSHAHSYLIKRPFCEYMLNTYPIEKYHTTAIDELLCLSIYGEDVVKNPHAYNFYNLDQPLDVLSTEFVSLCYEVCLTTQYASFSDLWQVDVNYEEYIKSSYPLPV